MVSWQHISRAILALVMVAVMATSASAADLRAAIARTGLPGDNPELVTAMGKSIESAGYTITELDADALCDGTKLTAEAFDLLVLPDAADLPAASVKPIEAYLRAGGDIIALNAPLWQRSFLKSNGKWTTADELGKANAGKLPERVVCGFSAEETALWTRSTSHADIKTRAESVAEGAAPGQKALHITIPAMLGWDTFVSPKYTQPFAPGSKLTVFSAKGGSGTSHVSIEWTEKDGSRWFVAVPLYPEWRQYVLKPEQFRFWQSNPQRGGPGDQFRPENAVSVTVGQAYSHTGPASGKQEYWIGPIGTASKVDGWDETENTPEPPALEILSPGYKFFNVNADRLSLMESGSSAVPAGMQIRSPHPRPSGGGFDKGRNWRWIPLVNALSNQGEWRGSPVSMMVNAEGSYKGGVWLSSGISGSDIFRSASSMEGFTQIAKQMSAGLFILDGGANFYTYFKDQPLKLGARVTNLGKQTPAQITVKVTVTDTESYKQAFSREWPLTLEPGKTSTVSCDWKPTAWPTGGYSVKVELLQNGRQVDRVSHSIHMWQPAKKKQFVTTKASEFILNGKRWRANGVNYMPSSGVAAEDGKYFEAWLSAASYDPEVIQRDLDHIKQLGMNAVSIFIYAENTKDQNLLDLLRRLDAHGMKASLSLRPGTPIDFQWKDISSIIKHYRLWENDTVFAYDLAWEPSFGTREERAIFDPEWEQWIIERYGSIANAERDWGYTVPRKSDGSISNPSPAEVDTDGAWRRMTAAYRRFLDTVLYKKYGAARRLVRSIDPNHLVSFRMSEAANPTFRWEGRIPYDFPYLAAAVDFLAPEGYGRISGWDDIKPGWFQNTYARWASPQKPMIWAEAGVSAWDTAQMAATPSKLEFQGALYGHFYRLISSSACSGIMYWWYPGGFRYGENSDYGIINPDGTDRPSTKAIKANGPAFLSGPSRKPTDMWIEIDRDAHPDGVAGIYSQVKQRFWDAIDKGQTPGLKTAGTGTDSANCPLVAVGNTPCNGSNPPKYLDTAIDSVQIMAADGQWTEVAKSGTVTVNASKPVKIKVEFTNLGEAKLLAPTGSKQTGRVYLVAKAQGTPLQLPIRAYVPQQESAVVQGVVTPAGLASPQEVVLHFEAIGRTPFGERFSVTLVGADGASTGR